MLSLVLNRQYRAADYWCTVSNLFFFYYSVLFLTLLVPSHGLWQLCT